MKANPLTVGVLAFILAIAAQQRGCALPEWLPTPSIVKPSATAAVYVYEKDDTAVPSAVLAALDKLNRDGITATTFDDDTRDGRGEVPDQHKAALISATEAGLPALVVTARNGDEVLRVIKAPTTETEVLEAVR